MEHLYDTWDFIIRVQVQALKSLPGKSHLYLSSFAWARSIREKNEFVRDAINDYGLWIKYFLGIILPCEVVFEHEFSVSVVRILNVFKLLYVNRHQFIYLVKDLVSSVYKTNHRHAFDWGLQFLYLIYVLSHMTFNPLFHLRFESIVISLSYFLHNCGKYLHLFYLSWLLYIHLFYHLIHGVFSSLEIAYLFINGFYGSRHFFLTLFEYSLDEFSWVSTMIFHKTLRAKGFLAALVRAEIAFVETM